MQAGSSPRHSFVVTAQGRASTGCGPPTPFCGQLYTACACICALDETNKGARIRLELLNRCLPGVGLRTDASLTNQFR